MLLYEFFSNVSRLCRIKWAKSNFLLMVTVGVHYLNRQSYLICSCSVFPLLQKNVSIFLLTSHGEKWKCITCNDRWMMTQLVYYWRKGDSALSCWQADFVPLKKKVIKNRISRVIIQMVFCHDSARHSSTHAKRRLTSDLVSLFPGTELSIISSIEL